MILSVLEGFQVIQKKREWSFDVYRCECQDSVDSPEILRRIHENIIKKNILETLENPNMSILHKMRLCYQPQTANISSGGLWKDWNCIL